MPGTIPAIFSGIGAIALMEKHSNHPATKGIVQNLINGAKANASESELEEMSAIGG